MPEYDEDGNELTPEEESGVVKTLRQKLAAAEKEAADVPTLRKELAIRDADLGTLNEFQRKALLSTHEGELTKEALRGTATNLGFIEAPKQEPQVPAEEQAAHGRIAEATAGAEPVDGKAPSFEAQLAAAKNDAEVAALCEANGIKVN